LNQSPKVSVLLVVREIGIRQTMPNLLYAEFGALFVVNLSTQILGEVGELFVELRQYPTTVHFCIASL
jgi:hypothetical protein